jgi:fumarate hydratase, class II
MTADNESFAPILWGKQTELSLKFFEIGEQRMPIALIHAIAWVKWSAAEVNRDLGRLEIKTANAVAAAALRVAAGEFDQQFPLSVWQTGSGTQSHMNVNEVIAALASGTTQRIHPNDDVNLGQSSNDVVPSAINLALVLESQRYLLPAVRELRFALQRKVVAFTPTIKIGRTHLQDATPISLGQEFSGYDAQIAAFDLNVRHALFALHSLAIGGTAVGTGMNTHPEFGSRVAAKLAAKFNLPLIQSPNLFAAMAGAEGLVAFHGTLKQLAISLMKIANDLRLMGSGPRAGLGELYLPQNEPGSSIMPGKVNPTQIEALNMVVAQVVGHDTAITFAASQGQFELNVYQPLFALNILDSLRLLADAVSSFTSHCIEGIRVNEARVEQLLQSSLMLVTALTPHIGYDQAAKIAEYAYDKDLTLRAAALELGIVSAADFDIWVNPYDMVGNE